MIDETLIKLGPYFMHALLLVLAILALLAAWLIVTGIRRRRAWRICAGAPIALYLVCVFGAWVVS
jgi:hypothetical protein